MGHGIEQAITRFVRSTSVTLKVLNSHDSDVLWRVQMLVQRQCIWELAIMKGRSNNGKVSSCYSSSKSKYKKKQKQEQKQHLNGACLEQDCPTPLEKRSECFCLRRKGACIDLTRFREIRKKGLKKWSAGFLLEACQTTISNSRWAKFAMVTRSRDNTHRQTTFIIFFFLF